MDKIKELLKNKKFIFFIVSCIIFICVAVVLIVVFSNRNIGGGDVLSSSSPANTNNTKHPEETTTGYEHITNSTIRCLGIDVSKWQKAIDWETVSKQGIEFAIIRVGLRSEDGNIFEDEYAHYNIQQADKYGILVGVYFFSTATNEKEAKEEAEWVLEFVKGYPISFPIVYDCEGYTVATSRMHNLNAEKRTDNALAFLNTVAEKGYDTMLYGARNELLNTYYWNIDRIQKDHRVWVAHYSNDMYPDVDKPQYSQRADAWQYTNVGKLEGISTDVDMVVSYFKNDRAEPYDSENIPESVGLPHENTTPGDEDVVCSVRFYKYEDSVTAKIWVNLRSLPSTVEGEIVGTLKSGEFLQRTAMSDRGWSRLIYNGQTVYAVSSYLSNEVVEQTEAVTTDAREYFEPTEDYVTAKIETNLRSYPSTASSEVVYTLKNGEYIKRIGINNITGWSMLDYNGLTVYAISSYLMVQE